MYPNERLDKRPVFKGFLMVSLVSAGLWLASLGSVAVAQPAGFQPFMQSSGEWLLNQQRPDGSFPNSVGDPPTLAFASVQAPSGLGMLSSWFATEDPDFLASAIAAGDYLINNFDLFPTSEPRIRTFDPLFFVRLSAVTGDSAYADFIQDNFWTPLANGTYGPDGDWGIAEYAASEIARRAGAGSAAAAWDLAMIAVAAEEAGVTTFRAGLAAGAATALESAADGVYILGERGFDILGLAGAVWVGALTGESVTPASGLWAGLSLSDLADALIDHQAIAGGFLQSSVAFSAPVDVTETVSQTTAFAVLALDALDANTYSATINSGLESLINTFQTPSGRISFFHPDADLSTVDDPKPFPYMHAYVLYSVNESSDPRESVAVPIFGAWGLGLLLMMMLSLGWVALAARK